jgi:hypothetical protein
VPRVELIGQALDRKDIPRATRDVATPDVLEDIKRHIASSDDLHPGYVRGLGIILLRQHVCTRSASDE